MADEFCSKTGKIKFTTNKAALRAAKTTLQKKPRKADRVARAMTFECEHCDRWHWGHGRAKK